MFFLEHLGHAVWFAWRSLLAVPWAIVRFRALHTQLHQIFLGALPLALVGGMTLGAVIWMHARAPLRTVGGPEAVEIMPQALAKVVVLELAAIIAGLIVAARSGASLGAELGSMRLTEQIDAMEVLGLSPLRELVAPRVVACMLSLPLLAVFITYAALGAGYLSEAFGGTMTLTKYVNDSLRLLSLRDVIPSLFRTVVFGYLIGVTGCYYGLTAHGGTEGLGRATTRAVVVSIFLVFVADVVLVLLTQIVL
jgi:phospholipid/cholesterol/gamma-HCH transport system permease protein